MYWTPWVRERYEHMESNNVFIDTIIMYYGEVRALTLNQVLNETKLAQ